MTRHKTVTPKPAPARAKRVKKAKPESRSLQHKHFGVGVVIGVYVSDSGNAVVDCDFNGTRRTLALDKQYWLGSVVMGTASVRR
jgi:hypothetical protein